MSTVVACDHRKCIFAIQDQRRVSVRCSRSFLRIVQGKCLEYKVTEAKM